MFLVNRTSANCKDRTVYEKPVINYLPIPHYYKISIYVNLTKSKFARNRIIEKSVAV